MKISPIAVNLSAIFHTIVTRGEFGAIAEAPIFKVTIKAPLNKGYKLCFSKFNDILRLFIEMQESLRLTN